MVLTDLIHNKIKDDYLFYFEFLRIVDYNYALFVKNFNVVD